VAFVAFVVVWSAVGSAEAGWYRLLPPTYRAEGEKDDAYLTTIPKIDSTVPLSEWEHVQSFDTAAECEAVNRRFLEDSQRILKDAATTDWNTLSIQDRVKRMLAIQNYGARCIATDDPRLR
jgi:hypothetical protein